MEWGPALGLLGAGIGAALAAMAAGVGIGRLSASASESIARQPEAAGDIKFTFIVTAAMIEGVALFGAVICYLIQSGSLEALNEVIKKSKF